MVKFLYCLILSFFGAIIVHITVLLLIPSYVGLPIMGRLETQEEAGQFISLKQDDPVLAHLDPAFRLRACHLDLADGPIRLNAEGNVPFWSLSLYDSEGNNLYSINKRVMPGGQLDLVIGDPIQIMDYRQDEALQGSALGNNVTTQHNITQGLVILRAYVPSSDWEPSVEDFLQTARCTKIG